MTGGLRCGQSREVLQGVEHFAIGANERCELALVDLEDGYLGAIALDIDVDIAVEIDDVEQALEVVGGRVTLLLEQVRGRRGLLFCLGAHELGPFVWVPPDPLARLLRDTRLGCTRAVAAASVSGAATSGAGAGPAFLAAFSALRCSHAS